MAKRNAKKSAKTGRKSTGTARLSPAPGTLGKLPKGAVTLIVICRAREGQEVMVEAELRALIAPSRREVGCIVYDLHRSLDVPGMFLFHEIWASRDAHKLHCETPHFLRWQAHADALLASREPTFW